jgi:site-specific DNA recombinase
MDRLHRQPRELEDFIALVEKHHVELANVGGDVDLSTPGGKMFARMKGNVAAYEIDQKVKRQRAANEQRAQNGKAWVVRVFGYDGNTVVEDEAEAIRKACAELLNGASLWGIAKQWNAAGIKTVKGYTWNGSTVRQVLSRARNAGLQTYDGEIMEGVETAWPAIVSRDTYDAVRALLADPKRHTGKRRARVHLLSGLAVCGLCDRKMGTTVRRKKSGGNRPVYQCKHVGCMRVVRDLAKTDEMVVDIVTGRLARPDAAAAFAKPTVDTKALNAKANEYRALIAAAEAEYDEGIIDGRRLAARKEKIQPKLDTVAATLLGANTSRKLDGIVGQPDAAERFAALPLDRQRVVIDTVCQVTIEPNTEPGGRFERERIRIEWR